MLIFALPIHTFILYDSFRLRFPREITSMHYELFEIDDCIDSNAILQFKTPGLHRDFYEKK